MRTIPTQMKVTAGVMAAVVMAMLAYQAGAMRMARAQPTAVATVSLSRVLDGLQERTVAQRELEDMKAALTTEDETRKKEINDLLQQLKDTVDDDARYRKQDEIDLKKLQYQAWQRVKAEQYDIEQGLRLQNLYKKIKSAIAEQVAADGYDLVLVDDSSDDFAYNPNAPLTRADQIKQQITNRRLLWGTERIDITDALITRMNNAYQAGALNTTAGPATRTNSPSTTP